MTSRSVVSCPEASTRIFVLLDTQLVFIPALAYTDLDEDFAVCRRTILQIGSNPKSPSDQYCLGLSHTFALNHKKDQAPVCELAARTWLHSWAAPDAAFQKFKLRHVHSLISLLRAWTRGVGSRLPLVVLFAVTASLELMG